MQWLSTAFQLVLLLLGVLAAWAAMDEARSLRSLRLRVEDFNDALGSLDERLKRLSGRFYASQQRVDAPRQPEPQNELGQACENWARAQREGPLSEAARCDCSYCEARRADRDVLRRQLKLQTHARKTDGNR